MKKIVGTLGLFLLGACAQNSGVISYGENQYMVSRQAATGFGGMGNLKAEALQEATAQCKKGDRQVQVIKEIDSQPPYVLGNYPRTEIHFRCVTLVN